MPWRRRDARQRGREEERDATAVMGGAKRQRGLEGAREEEKARGETG
jgi:hypothetical protein